MALTLHFVPYASWDVREETLNIFTKFLSAQNIRDAVDIGKSAASAGVQKYVNEIAHEGAGL